MFDGTEEVNWYEMVDGKQVYLKDRKGYVKDDVKAIEDKERPLAIEDETDESVEEKTEEQELDEMDEEDAATSIYA